VERGRLRLDAPVGPLLTRRPPPDGPGDPADVTLRRLLSHTSGLPARNCEARDVQPTIEACLDGEGSGGPLARTAAPGAEFTYTNAGFLLAQLILEERTGRRFADLMDDDVLRPLGMRDSTFADGPSAEEAANGLVSTAADLARFVAALGPGPGSAATPGRGVLTPASVRETLTPAPGTTGNRGQTGDAAYGLGMALERIGPSGDLLASHKGNNPGWTALIAALPERGDGLVVLSNGDQARELTTAVLCHWAAWAARALPQRCTGPYVLGG
jgi:CubicO group peptidase (beta-lactamase class C family)